MDPSFGRGGSGPAGVPADRSIAPDGWPPRRMPRRITPAEEPADQRPNRNNEAPHADRANLSKRPAAEPDRPPDLPVRSGAYIRGAEHQVSVQAGYLIGVRIGGKCVTEGAGADFADPLVVLVLVVDQGCQQVGGDEGQLGWGRDSAARDVVHPGV